jgi:hypothetical protein
MTRGKHAHTAATRRASAESAEVQRLQAELDALTTEVRRLRSAERNGQIAQAAWQTLTAERDDLARRLTTADKALSVANGRIHDVGLLLDLIFDHCGPDAAWPKRMFVLLAAFDPERLRALLAHIEPSNRDKRRNVERHTASGTAVERQMRFAAEVVRQVPEALA